MFLPIRYKLFLYFGWFILSFSVIALALITINYLFFSMESQIEISFLVFFQLIALILILAASLRSIHYKMANKLADVGEWEKALDHYNWALRLNPKRSEIYTSLGNVFADQNQWGVAIPYYKQAQELNSNDIESLYGLGHAHLRLIEWNRAHAYFERAYLLKRGIPLNWKGEDKSIKYSPNLPFKIGKHKLKHEIEQLEFLLKKDLIPGYFKQSIHRYQKLLADYSEPLNQNLLVELKPEHNHLISNAYDRNIYIEEPQIKYPIINPNLDVDNIQKRYFETGAGMVSFDNFLSENVLKALTDFCLNSSIWNDYTKSGGYLGAYMDDGFNAPFLYEIAQAMRSTFPEIFKGMPLIYMWAFKYDSTLNGIGLHADSAVVNVNFWITPDEANLNPDTGGLGVYDIEAPQEWDFSDYNSDTEAIEKFLEEHQPEKYEFPYKQNRVVMFNSRLFHETSPFQFKEGYENRRINITMLFGTHSFKYHKGFNSNERNSSPQ